MQKSLHFVLQNKTQETVESQSKETESGVVVSTEVGEPELEYVELDWVCRLQGKKTDLEMIQEALDKYFLEKLNLNQQKGEAVKLLREFILQGSGLLQQYQCLCRECFQQAHLRVQRVHLPEHY